MRTLSIVFLACTAHLSSSATAVIKTTPSNSSNEVHSFSSNQNVFPVKSSFRVSDEMDNEERVFPSENMIKTIDREIKNFLKPIWWLLHDKWKGVPNRFHFEEAKNSALAREAVLAFIKRPDVNAVDRYLSYKKLSLVELLTKTYNADVIAQVLFTARNSASKVTRNNASRLWVQLLKHWKQNGLKEDDVFFLLKLNAGPDKSLALRDGRMKLLVEYTHFTREKVPYYHHLIRALIRGYGGEDEFALVLGAAAKSDDAAAKKLAKYLENDYLYTIFMGGKTKGPFPAISLFKSLKLNDGHDKYMALIDGRFATLEKYIKMKYNDKWDYHFIATLRKGYGGDGMFALVLVSALEHSDEALKAKAEALKTKYFRVLSERHVNYDDLLSRLTTSNGLDQYLALSDGRVALLEDYIKFANGEKISDTDLFTTLLKGYGGEDRFAVLLSAATESQDKAARVAALELESKYFKTLSSAGVTSKNLFTRLKIEDKGASAAVGVLKKKLLERYATFRAENDPGRM